MRLHILIILALATIVAGCHQSAPADYIYYNSYDSTLGGAVNSLLSQEGWFQMFLSHPDSAQRTFYLSYSSIVIVAEGAKIDTFFRAGDEREFISCVIEGPNAEIYLRGNSYHISTEFALRAIVKSMEMINLAREGRIPVGTLFDKIDGRMQAIEEQINQGHLDSSKVPFIFYKELGE